MACPDNLTRSDAFLVLNGLANVGPVMLRRLLDRFSGDPIAILSASSSDLKSVKGVGEKASTAIRGWDSSWLDNELGRLAERSGCFLTREDPSFPPALLETFDPPIGLYCTGAPPHPDEPCVAIVGTRQASLYGLRMAKTLAADLARMGFCIVSGMARGIDAAAHEGALEAGGRTVAVFGCGPDVIYPPEHLDLYRRITASGAVLTEFPFGRRADRQTFPMRNRVVAGMSVGAIVVESAAAGGSLITARFAAEQGRQVFALPGRVDQATSEGCHKLIREGATLIRNAADVAEELAPSLGLALPSSSREEALSASAAAPSPQNLTPTEQALHAVLADGSILNPDALAERTKLPAQEVMATLTMLEIKRLVSRRPDGAFETR